MIHAASQEVANGAIHIRVFQPNGEIVRTPLELVVPSEDTENPRILMPSGQKVEEEAPGEYRFTVRPGEYYVRAGTSADASMRTYFPDNPNPENAKVISVAQGEHVRADIHLSTAPKFKITGRIVDAVKDNHPHYYSGVLLRSANPTVREYKYEAAYPGVPFCCAVNTVPDLGVSVRVVGDRFEINGVRAGEYELVASILVGDIKPGEFVLLQTLPATKPLPYSRLYRSRVPIKVVNRDVEGIDVAVTRGVDLNGRIVSNGKSINAKETSIQLSNIEDHNFELASADKNGRFAFQNLIDGEYRLSVGTLPGTAYVEEVVQDGKLIPDGRDLNLISNVKITVGKTSSPLVQIIVNPNGGTISGTITDGKEALIVLEPAETSLGSSVRRWSATSLKGDFQIGGGVPPGSYRIYAFKKDSDISRIGLTSRFPIPIEEKGLPIKVEPGRKTLVQLKRIESE